METRLSELTTINNENSTPINPAASRGDEDSKLLSSEVLQSVVKIYASALTPNHLLPWQRTNQSNVTGSGFVVDMKRGLIFTNAHVVANAEFVEVRKHGDHERFLGNVVYVGVECDLAVIYVSDPSFWGSDVASLPLAGVDYAMNSNGNGSNNDVDCDDTRPSISVDALAKSTCPFAGLPPLQTETKVVGYPMGGDQISITSGVVSRIDTTPYDGLDTFLVAIQIDAAINSGNSGGPALSLHSDDSGSSTVSKKRVIGLAFQSLSNADNIGYIIPVPVIADFARSFIQTVLRGVGATGNTAGVAGQPLVPGRSPPLLPPQGALRQYHQGFKSAGFFIQRLTNAALRHKYGLPRRGKDGVLVRFVFPGGGCEGVLFPGDVLLKIDGYDVANDCTIEFRRRERIFISHILQLAPGDTVRMDILRDGQRLCDVAVPLSVHPRLVPSSLFSVRFHETPPYALLGGFVVTTLTLPLLLEWGAQTWFKEAPRHLVEATLNQFPSAEREEVVVVVQVLPHVVNKGYGQAELLYKPVRSVDGTRVRSFAHFVELVERRRGSSATHESIGDGVTSSSTAGGGEQVEGEEENEELVSFTIGEGLLEDQVALPVQASLRADRELMMLYNIPSLVQLSAAPQSTGAATLQEGEGEDDEASI